MGWIEAIVLGIVQGLTEFLPISSSAHVRIVGGLVPGWGDPGAAFTAVTQLGTEAAVLLYFRKDIWNIVSTWTLSLFRRELRSEPDARMGWYVIVGTLPIGVLGFLFEDYIDQQLRSLVFIGLCLVVFGAILGLVDRTARTEKKLTELTMRDGLLYGLAQAMALIPGVSRSGGTITMGLLLGYTREAALRYSFLLAIPAVLASGVFKLKDLGEGGGPPLGPTIAATLVAFAVGLGVIVYVMQWIKKHSFVPFVVYRLVLGCVVLTLVATGVLHAYA